MICALSQESPRCRIIHVRGLALLVIMLVNDEWVGNHSVDVRRRVKD